VSGTIKVRPTSLNALKSALSRGYWVDPVLGVVYSPSGQPVKMHLNSGYLRWCISGYGSIGIHKTVAYCLFGEAAFGGSNLHVRHLNSIKTDNTGSNIALGTCKENRADMTPEMLKFVVMKAASARHIATRDQVNHIRCMVVDHKNSIASVARLIGLPYSTVYKIAISETYREV
jgi:hypothetical protein